MLHTPSDVIYKDTTNAVGFQKMCEDHMKSKLAKKPEIYESLLPTFAPACRRLTPGPGVSYYFLISLSKGLNETNIKFH